MTFIQPNPTLLQLQAAKNGSGRNESSCRSRSWCPVMKMRWINSYFSTYFALLPCGPAISPTKPNSFKMPLIRSVSKVLASSITTTSSFKIEGCHSDDDKAKVTGRERKCHPWQHNIFLKNIFLLARTGTRTFHRSLPPFLSSTPIMEHVHQHHRQTSIAFFDGFTEARPGPYWARPKSTDSFHPRNIPWVASSTL